MRSERYRFVLLVMIAAMLGLTACAPPAYVKKKVDMVWPLPPEKPRVKYIDYFTNTLDLGAKGSLADTVFGASKVESFVKPYGVAVDKEGRVYVTDYGKVWVLDFRKKTYHFLGATPGVGKVAFPTGVVVSSDGRIFVSDIDEKRVFVYDAEGKTIGAIGKKGEFKGPAGIAVDEKARLLYVADTRKNLISVFSLDDYRKIREIGGKKGIKPGEFLFPTNLAVDPAGRLYVVDTGNCRVQVFDNKGKFIRSWGRRGDVPGNFVRPKGIGIDAEGHIYVADAAFQNFQIFSPEGQLLLVVGKAGTEPGDFSLPAGLTVDSRDRIYVVNQVPASLQIFQYLGRKWKQAHPELAKKILEPFNGQEGVKGGESSPNGPQAGKNAETVKSANGK